MKTLINPNFLKTVMDCYGSVIDYDTSQKMAEVDKKRHFITREDTIKLANLFEIKIKSANQRLIEQNVESLTHEELIQTILLTDPFGRGTEIEFEDEYLSDYSDILLKLNTSELKDELFNKSNYIDEFKIIQAIEKVQYSHFWNGGQS